MQHIKPDGLSFRERWSVDANGRDAVPPPGMCAKISVLHDCNVSKQTCRDSNHGLENQTDPPLLLAFQLEAQSSVPGRVARSMRFPGSLKQVVEACSLAVSSRFGLL